MDKNEVRDESLLEAASGGWTYETLTDEERERFQRVSDALTEDWDYISYNDFIQDMNKKYGTNPGQQDRQK